MESTPTNPTPNVGTTDGQLITVLSVSKEVPVILTLSSSHQPTVVPATNKAKLLAKVGLDSKDDVALDVDVGCGCYDGQGKLLDVVWYGKVRAFDGAVRLMYDTFIGMNKLYSPSVVEESLSVRLLNLPEQVQALVLFVHCHHNHALKQLTAGKASLKVSDHHSVHELTLTAFADDVAGVALWRLCREHENDDNHLNHTSDKWQVWAMSEPVAGGHIGEMATHWQTHKRA